MLQLWKNTRLPGYAAVRIRQLDPTAVWYSGPYASFIQGIICCRLLNVLYRLYTLQYNNTELPQSYK
jgi:hypothetical protein